MSTERIGRILEEGERFVLTTHVNPDGDGFGAELALHRHLRARGKDSRILNPEPHERRLGFLLEPTDRVEVFSEARHGEWARAADAVFLLDVNTLARLGALAPVVEEAQGSVVCIDHHRPGEDVFDVTCVREEACATGEILYELLDELGLEVTTELAWPLYVALLTDTGSFRFSRTSPRVHEIASRLLDLGVRPEQVYRHLYEDRSLAEVLLTGDVLTSMGTAADGRVAWQKITREMVEARGASFDEVSDVINYTIAIAGVEIGVLFKELGPRTTKASLRSKGRIDVNDFARGLGGGGHRHAAGIVLEVPFEEGCRRVLDALEDTFAALDED